MFPDSLKILKGPSLNLIPTVITAKDLSQTKHAFENLLLSQTKLVFLRVAMLIVQKLELAQAFVEMRLCRTQMLLWQVLLFHLAWHALRRGVHVHGSRRALLREHGLREHGSNAAWGIWLALGLAIALGHSWL